MRDTKGFNPFKFNFGAASDSHNTVVPYRQENFFGGPGAFWTLQRIASLVGVS